MLLRCDAKVGNGDRCRQIEPRQQPAYGDREQTENAEEDEQAARAPGHANHQYCAEEQEECQESERDGPAEQLVELVFVDERLEQLVRLRRLDEVESGVNSTDSFGRVLRDQLSGVHHNREASRVGHGHVPQIVDLQRRPVLQRSWQMRGLARGRKRRQYNSLGNRKYLDYLISHIDEETIQLLARIENLDQPIVKIVVSVEAC